MQLQLSWTDPVTGDSRQPRLTLPIALGRVFVAMPELIGEQRVSRIVLDAAGVADYHALITGDHAETILVVDQNSSTGTLINGVRLPSGSLIQGDRLQIGPVTVQIQLTTAAQATDSDRNTCGKMVGFLFKRRCDRLTTEGCPYCNSGEVRTDPYFVHDRSVYPGYGNYSRGYWGSGYYHNRDYYTYNSTYDRVDFTDADGASVMEERYTDYEQDFGAS